MTDIPATDSSVYEWQECSLLLPRIGKWLDRNGIHTRLIMPGTYYVRRSRTLAKPIYRRFA